jgi:malate permease and related proteins
MNQANNVFLITLALVGFGYLLKRFDFLSEKDGKVLSKFLMHTTFPALMVVSMARMKLDSSLLVLPLLSVFLGSICLLMAWFVFKKYPNNVRGLLTMSVAGMNTGLFAYPIMEGIWGRDALVYAIMFDIGNTVLVFGLVYTMGSYFASQGAGSVDVKILLKKISRLPPLQGMAIGLIINVLSIQLPTIAFDFLDILAKANKPIVLLLLGIYLNFTLDKQQIWGMAKVLGIRYGYGLVAVVLLRFLMPPSVEQSILIVCCILPIALSLLPFSDELNYDSRTAGLLVNATLLISFGLMWALVWGLKLV